MSESRPRKQFPMSERLGLDREEAAAYAGYSPNVFDRMVSAGEMPKPRRSAVSKRLIWSRLEIDQAVHRLPTGDGAASEYEGVEF